MSSSGSNNGQADKRKINIPKILLWAILIIGFGLYLYALITVGNLSLNHSNFQIDEATLELVLDENNEPIPQNPPQVPDELTNIIMVVGTALAINFGAVLGIEFSSSVGPEVTQKPNVIKSALISVWNNLKHIEPHEWGSLAYFAGLVIVIFFFIQDKGLEGQSASIAQPIANMWQTVIGIVAGGVASITKNK